MKCIFSLSLGNGNWLGFIYMPPGAATNNRSDNYFAFNENSYSSPLYIFILGFW